LSKEPKATKCTCRCSCCSDKRHSPVQTIDQQTQFSSYILKLNNLIVSKYVRSVHKLNRRKRKNAVHLVVVQTNVIAQSRPSVNRHSSVVTSSNLIVSKYVRSVHKLNRRKRKNAVHLVVVQTNVIAQSRPSINRHSSVVTSSNLIT